MPFSTALSSSPQVPLDAFQARKTGIDQPIRVRPPHILE
jgi:hypothetical protein